MQLKLNKMEKIIILNQRENPIFKRKELELSIEAEITPKINETESMIAKEFSTEEGNVKIRKIKGKFGSKKFIITANIYHSKEEKDNIEPKSKKAKIGEKKE